MTERRPVPRHVYIAAMRFVIGDCKTPEARGDCELIAMEYT